MEYLGKVFFEFKDIKKVANLPQDALLKRYIINNLDDAVEIEFYTNENIENSISMNADTPQIARRKRAL